MKPTQPTTRRLLGAVLLSASLVLVATGCGDKKSDASADTTVAAAAADTAPADTAAPDSTPADTAAAADTTPAAAPDAAASPAGGVKLTDGTAGPDATVTITSGQFNPATLSIAVGDIVTFTSGDKGTYAVIVGDLDGATVTGGLIETFTFSKPGTYAVREDISGSTATITVA